MDYNATVRVHPVRPNQKLVYVFDGYNAPERIDLLSFGKTEITFGRDASNDIVLSSPLVSRHHGKFVFDNNHWTIEDLGSTNGIIHNDAEEALIEMKEDDIIRIDDSIESVPEGVLFVFPSDAYASEWTTTIVLKTEQLFTGIPGLEKVSAEEKDGEVLLHVPSSVPLFINQHKCAPKTILHERDFLSIADRRVVYTSNAIFDILVSTPTAIPYTNGYAEDPAQLSDTFVNNTYASRVYNQSDVNGSYDEYDDSNSGHTDAYDSESKRSQPKFEYSSQGVNTGSARNFFASTSGYNVLCVVFAMLLWGITIALWTSEGEAALLVILACAVFGWRALNRIQPAMFIWMPWIGWVIYISVKFVLSALIGLFVAPFKIAKWLAQKINESM